MWIKNVTFIHIFKKTSYLCTNSHTMDDFDRDSRASDWFYDDNEYADYDIADVEGYYPGCEEAARRKRKQQQRRKAQRHTSTPHYTTSYSTSGTSTNELHSMDYEDGNKFLAEYEKDPLGETKDTAPIASISIVRIIYNIASTVCYIVMFNSRALWKNEFTPWTLLALLGILIVHALLLNGKVKEEPKADALHVLRSRLYYQIVLTLFCTFDLCYLIYVLEVMLSVEFVSTAIEVIYIITIIYHIGVVVLLRNNIRDLKKILKTSR